MQTSKNRVGLISPHVEDFRVGWERRFGEREQPLDGPGPAGDDLKTTLTARQGGQLGIPTGGHVAQIGHSFEAPSRAGQAVEHGVLYILGHHLSEGAAAVDEPACGWWNGFGRRRTAAHDGLIVWAVEADVAGRGLAGPA